MQIFFRPKQPSHNSRVRALLTSALLLGVAALGLSAAAQTLARPGWVGSGLTSEAWWQTAVVYRVQPKSFQDSNGDGAGDLRGLADRLDYLQSIGVDAVLLESDADEAGFDDLLSDASRHHIRILVELGAGDAAHPLSTQQEIARARMWLGRGVAGVYVPAVVVQSIASRVSFEEAVLLMQQLRTMADSFPGGRIIVSGDTPAVDSAAHDARPSRGTHSSGPELVDGHVSTSTWTAQAFRLQLAMADAPAEGGPLLEIARLPASTSSNHDAEIGREKILAAMLLSSRGAISFTYGQEIGLSSAPEAVMQWTPTNFTKARSPEQKALPPVVYGAYHPYVPPAPSSVIGRRPSMPKVALDTASAPPPVDPDTLPGFSSKLLPPSSPSFHVAEDNVAVEDSDPDSLLSFYRHVMELHGGNATLRNGSVSFLNHDDEDALVWLRRAPAGARTVASVIVACNLSDHPVVLSLNEDLARLHVRTGTLRPLLTSKHIDHVAQSTGHIALSAHSVYIGELYHFGAYAY